MRNKYPLYIPSKKRSDSRLTAKALEAMGLKYFIVVEKNEVETYKSVVDLKLGTVLELPDHYFDDYDKFDDLGRTKSTGPGPARNFIWDHSIESGATSHWVMDDNIRYFARLNRNLKIVCLSGAIFRAQEDFCDRYTNIAMAGPHYDFFAPAANKHPPFIWNTRVYSCNLIRNEMPYRWRGRYNEDTDLSLRMLKDGWCTVQFFAFLQKKAPNQTVKGGNSAVFYDSEGTKPKSEMQVKMHPDVSTLVWKFGRWHHHVDYSQFRKNKPLLKSGLDIPDRVNNFGMKVVHIG